MKELIEKLQAADGPRQELNAEIECLCGLEDSELTASVFRHADSAVAWVQVDGGNGVISRHAPRNYTSSIDAALTLVPDGWEWDISLHPKRGAYVETNTWPMTALSIGAHKSPAIAICIAALKARQAIELEGAA